jgi:drug/metabolite transporter (DMT)-like permease
LPWLAGAVLSGGIIGPVLLLFGLAQSSASEAALLLNLESVLTLVMALPGVTHSPEQFGCADEN